MFKAVSIFTIRLVLIGNMAFDSFYAICGIWQWKNMFSFITFDLFRGYNHQQLQHEKNIKYRQDSFYLIKHLNNHTFIWSLLRPLPFNKLVINLKLDCNQISYVKWKDTTMQCFPDVECSCNIFSTRQSRENVKWFFF